MNEIELKNKFMDFLLSSNNNSFVKKSSTSKIFEIKNEGLNKKFDLIIAIVKSDKLKFNKIKKETIEIDDNLKSIFFRNTLLKSISEEYKIKIQNLIIYPIEIKSDKDKLDQRLANQVIDAILVFGRSVVILDNNHYTKIKKNGFYKIIPSTILGYSNEQEMFILIQEYDKLYTDSLLNIHKFNLIRTLEKSKMSNIDINYNNLYRNLKTIQNINQKLIYNQIFDYENIFFDSELEFIKNLSNITQKISLKNEITKLVKESKNYRITEFIN
ncbi:MAG TPA: hypothetical protein VIY08_10610 [Candidatus Nitrosocosmicus sp.]